MQQHRKPVGLLAGRAPGLDGWGQPVLRRASADRRV